MAADPQVIAATHAVAKTIAVYGSIAVLLAAIIGIPLGLLVRSLENKAAKLGRDFRGRKNKRKNIVKDNF